MSEDSRDFLLGLQHRLAGDTAGAVDVLERAVRRNGDSPALAAQLLDAYIEAERMADADALAARMLARWPRRPEVMMAVAPLRELQGRPEEALDLLVDARADLSGATADYPRYLRLLIACRRYDEAVRESERGMTSLWTPVALLAQALGYLHGGDAGRGAALLALIDPVRAEPLVADWLRTLERAGALGEVRDLLARGAAAPNADGVRWLIELAALVGSAAESSRNGPTGPDPHDGRG